ncbi:MAG: PspC domain-containing protein [Bacteroidales bacterium]|nr:PspC domain-containing protein [Bacteroidales bacterium]
MEQRRLYRSKTDRVIAGVCGGLGEYLNTDPVLFRVLFAVGVILGGGGLIIYLVLWIVAPEKELPSSYQDNSAKSDFQANPLEAKTEGKPQHKYDGNLWAGIILITLGGLFLMDKFVPRFDFSDLWPVILVVIGILLLVRNFSFTKDGE